jgi:hypothetical protein
MRLASESYMTARINEMVSKKECIAWKINTTTRRGLPDCQYIGPKNNLWIEYKRIVHTPKIIHAYKIPTAIQLSTVKKLIKLNEEVWLVIFLDEGLLVLKNQEWEKPVTITPENIYTPQELVNEIHNFMGVKCTS